MLHTLLSHDVPEITVAAASQAEDKAVFLDAREPAEFNVSHIAGAIPVGYDQFDLSALAGIPKDQQIIVYCSVGYRSEKVSEQLLAAGYQRVANLYGGIFEWKNQGHPVVNPAGEPTDEIHAYNRTWGMWLKKGATKVY
ncbi:MAG: rhodanese-like domain-containing protein [Bacteroidetes bacterium]|nr:MAG: rhodanese-like domain-containing protein [Bacteroidota bacterium]PTM15116.1 MAG: rhodanese-like domain-containing protein [Bacteroidota bacterium]